MTAPFWHQPASTSILGGGRESGTENNCYCAIILRFFEAPQQHSESAKMGMYRKIKKYKHEGRKEGKQKRRHDKWA